LHGKHASLDPTGKRSHDVHAPTTSLARTQRGREQGRERRREKGRKRKRKEERKNSNLHHRIEERRVRQ
jgi:hypothetical protein